MRTLQIAFGLVLFTGLATGKHCHGSHCPVPGAGEVDSAIDQTHMHYNDRLCLEILLIDCATHVVVGDERVCGNDGKEYKDHCYFAHARCEFLHSDGHHLEVALHGPCPQPTTTTLGVTSTTTAEPSHATSPTTGETTLASTTENPIHGIIQNVFCQNADSVDCNQDMDLKCGSDGFWYLNSCEFSKAKCLNPSLNTAELTSCSAQ